MELAPLSIHVPRPAFLVRCTALLFVLYLATCFPALADKVVANILGSGSFEDVQPTYVPWAGVDGSGNIRGIDGKQLMVNDEGKIDSYPFAPSVAVGDLNGDGKTDLVMGDSWGYFWYYPNSGTPQVPAFTQAEVIPIWLGEERLQPSTEGVANVVPRLQLVDLDGNRKLDVVAGTYVGKLFRIRNIGSPEKPNFKPTQGRDNMWINTHKNSVLWCNYLAPFFTSAFAANPASDPLDLVMGEGTYSANSIYLLHNTDSSPHPVFDEAHLKKIIPGMGLEQLTPQVVDWNHDGKPDVICGDRTGFLDLFLNTSTDPANPTFSPPTHIKIAGNEELGHAITVTVCDLWNNHLPNLLIGKDDGTVQCAVNTGTLGNPVFNTMVPLKGVLPPTYHYVSPVQWVKDQVWGQAYEMVGVTNPQLEPGFAFPDGVKSKYALKFWVWPYKNLFFERYFVPEENGLTEHVLNGTEALTLKMNTRYNVHFWVLAPQNSVAEFRWSLEDGGREEGKWAPPWEGGTIPSSSSWTEYNSSFRISNDPDPTLMQYGYGMHFRWHGQATFYITDLQVQELGD